MDAGRIFEAHYESLSRYLFRLTGDSDSAADAAQEAFSRLLDQSEPIDEPKAWLFRVATNVVRENARTGKRRLQLLESQPDRAPVGDAPPTPDEEFESRIERQRVREALSELREKDRIALLMREEGFAQKEIAEELGTTTGSVGTLIARAMERLAEKLAEPRSNQ